ncbi:hypothetical protein ABZW11_34140 [Nonomuraea sp. NPDC004580]|uniref:hypothetical protein n=1 Tax=Nonomuraea sp. NPDC004580 TaxID=3154552 RepID=UPI00339F355F
MTRSEFDDIRAFLADEATHADDLLRIARTLIDDLEHAQLREAVLRTHYLRLLTAARATVAADIVGSPDPLGFVRHELAERGQLPEDGEAVHRILADARAAAALLACLESRDCEGPAREGRSPERRSPERRSPEGQALPGQFLPDRTAELPGRPALEAQAVEGQAVEGQAVEGQAQERDGLEARAPEGEWLMEGPTFTGQGFECQDVQLVQDPQLPQEGDVTSQSPPRSRAPRMRSCIGTARILPR